MSKQLIGAVVVGLGVNVRFAPPTVIPEPEPRSISCATNQVGARASHSLAYDVASRRVVMFGGVSADTTAAMPRSLWAWNGRAWTCIAADGPPGRADAFLAFDAARGRLVLFGGRVFEANRRVRFLRDTWEWDGTRWTLADTAGPGPRIHGAVAYDAVRRAVVIHGGGGADSSLHDTWEWTGTTWREVRVRAPAGAIGDALLPTTRGLTFLMATRDPCPSGHRATPYEVRGDSLGSMGSPGPCVSPISPATAAPDGFLLYTGWNKDEPAKAWTWKGNAWLNTPTAPPRRRGTAMAYDQARNRVVLFGGDGESGLLGDTWEWDGRRWTRAIGP